MVNRSASVRQIGLGPSYARMANPWRMHYVYHVLGGGAGIMTIISIDQDWGHTNIHYHC